MRAALLPCLLAVTAISGCGFGSQTRTLASDDWLGCEVFATQSQAQRGWEKAGQPEDVPRNAQGLVCAQLGPKPSTPKPSTPKPGSTTTPTPKPSTPKPGSTTTTPPPSSADGAKTTDCKTSDKPVVVTLSRAKYPETSFHVEIAIRKYGQPEVVRIDRTNTDANRDAWERITGPGWDTNGDGVTEDRDEWPVAASASPTSGRGANIALIDLSDNRGAGSSMGAQLRPYCDGTPFRFAFTGEYPRPVQITVIADHGKKVGGERGVIERTR